MVNLKKKKVKMEVGFSEIDGGGGD